MRWSKPTGCKGARVTLNTKYEFGVIICVNVVSLFVTNVPPGWGGPAESGEDYV